MPELKGTTRDLVPLVSLDRDRIKILDRGVPPSTSSPRAPNHATYFALLPPRGRQGEPKYVAEDVFGYRFLSDVSMADYKDGEVTWQGFLRPYRDAQEAKAMFQEYIAGVKKDGAEVKPLAVD